MKVFPIIGANAKLKPTVLRKTANLMAAAALGTGLLLSAPAKAQDVKQDSLQKNISEMSIDEKTSETKDSVKGGLLFGAALLTFIGACALGNHIHDKNRN